MTERSVGFESEHDIPRPKLAKQVMLAVLTLYLVLGLINIVLDNPAGDSLRVPSVLCIMAVYVLQLTHLSARAYGWPAWRKFCTLTAQTVLTYAPFFLFNEVWGGMAGFLAGSFLLMIRRPLAWVFFMAVAGSMIWFAAWTYHTAAWISYYGLSTMLMGLVTYGIVRLAQIASELYLMRGELARMAVSQERLRFARDLHDLLGFSLSSITLKSELTYRLVQKQPERAQQELTDILRIARQALADVRAVASSYRQMSLTAELASAKSMLEAAEIFVDVRLDWDVQLSPELDTVLATTLREGVTNILRHSKVQHCMISAGTYDGAVRLEIGNDGVGSTPTDVFAHKGSGLSNLTERLAAFGGSLNAGVGRDGWFRLAAQAPLQPSVPPAAGSGRNGREAAVARGGVDDDADQDSAR